MLCDLMKEALEDVGYEVEVAHDSATGLFAAAEFEPDLVTVDHKMPGGDGEVLIRALREHRVFHHVPILGVAADIRICDTYYGLVCDFLATPMGAGEFTDRVAKLLSECKRSVECPCPYAAKFTTRERR